ncbi:MAG: hypothetical protein A2020_09890 [Lentisphaerae bacterium GWF2_45_14]|nr:MAG: hypothetical protein A2020_09890 [Lentisphaerae bacterium GWF2_45_14]
MLGLTSDSESIKINRIVLGLGPKSVVMQRSDYYGIFDNFIENGGNCIDTGRVYGTESVLGEWMAERKNRTGIILCTKGGCSNLVTHVRRLKREDLNSDLEESLNALKTDYIDIYYLHRDDPSLPVGGIMETLHRYVKAGKVRFIGASNWSTARIAEANDFAVENHFTPFSVSQPCWSLGYTDSFHHDHEFAYMGDSEYRWYLKAKLPVMAHSSLANGYFSKRLNGEALHDNIRKRYDFAINETRLERVRILAEQLKVSPTEIVLGYITCNLLNAVAVVSYHAGKQEKECLAAMNIKLTTEQVAYLHG